MHKIWPQNYLKISKNTIELSKLTQLINVKRHKIDGLVHIEYVEWLTSTDS